MKYQFVKKFPENQPLVISYFSDEALNEQAHLNEFDITFSQTEALKPALKNSGIWQQHQQQAVLWFNLGKKQSFNASAFLKAIDAILKQLQTIKAKSFSLCMPTCQADFDCAQQVILAIEAHCYQFKIKQKAPAAKSFEEVNLLMPQGASTIEHSQAIAHGMHLAKDLANKPANHCTPATLAETAQQLAYDDDKMQCNVMDKKTLEKMGMGALLAVGQGSSVEPKLIELHYRNGGSAAPIVLVGKGITFDSGGLSLKPSAGMEEMKFDMGGAASVLGTMKALSEAKLPLNVIALVPSCENLPGPDAIKPGDIVTSYSGKTIEILNTDAEGRLILCDALAYAEQYKPAKVVDIATLTGAMIIALGHVANGIMGNDQSVCDELLTAAKATNDKAWQLPLWDDYQPLMDSNIADISNMASSRSAGSISAACFLARFTENYKWAHIDCAGTAWQSGKNKAATGRPVPLLFQFLANQV